MEAQTALVWTNGRVELHTVATVDLHLAFVVNPGHAELQNAVLFVFGVLGNDRLEGVEHLVDGL